MYHDKRRKLFVSIGLSLLFSFLGIGILVSQFQFFPDYFQLKQYLMNTLSTTETFTSEGDQSPERNSKNNVIYILGGPIDNQDFKFQIASELYHKHLAWKIWLLHTPFLMEYDPQKGRNLSSKEWATGRLTSRGVDQKDIEFVQIEKGFFGTFSEAKIVCRLAGQRGFKNLILVTSRHHTKRSWESFYKFSQEQKIYLYIYTAKDYPYFRELLLEYFKLRIYEIFLL